MTPPQKKNSYITSDFHSITDDGFTGVVFPLTVNPVYIDSSMVHDHTRAERKKGLLQFQVRVL